MSTRLGMRLKMSFRRALQPLCERPGYFSCRDQRRFLHDFTRLHLPDRFASRLDRPGPDHDLILARLIDYYHAIKCEASALGAGSGEDMWREITRGHSAFEAALEARDAAQVSAASDRRSVARGAGQGTTEAERRRVSELYLSSMA